MSQLRHAYPDFQAANAEVFVIAAAPLGAAGDFARELELPFAVLSDLAEKTYVAYGLGKGLAVRPRTPFEYLRLLWREKRLYRPIGDVMQVGGDFVVDRAGIIRFAHSSEDPTDRPDVAELLRLIANLP